MDKEQARQLLAERDGARAAAVRLGVAVARALVVIVTLQETLNSGRFVVSSGLADALRRAARILSEALTVLRDPNAPAGDAPPPE